MTVENGAASAVGNGTGSLVEAPSRIRRSRRVGQKRTLANRSFEHRLHVRETGRVQASFPAAVRAEPLDPRNHPTQLEELVRLDSPDRRRRPPVRLPERGHDRGFRKRKQRAEQLKQPQFGFRRVEVAVEPRRHLPVDERTRLGVRVEQHVADGDVVELGEPEVDETELPIGVYHDTDEENE